MKNAKCFTGKIYTRFSAITKRLEIIHKTSIAYPLCKSYHCRVAGFLQSLSKRQNSVTCTFVTPYGCAVSIYFKSSRAVKSLVYAYYLFFERDRRRYDFKGGSGLIQNGYSLIIPHFIKIIVFQLFIRVASLSCFRRIQFSGIIFV